MLRVRPKVKLAFIQNDPARKETFRKRQKGLMKKIQELSILCDVKACAVVYSPYGQEPEVWPSLPEAQRLAMEYENVPEIESMRRKFNQWSFVEDMLSKVEQKLEKSTKEVEEKEMSRAMFPYVGAIISKSFTGQELDNLSAKELNNLKSFVGKNLRDIHYLRRTKRLQGVRGNEDVAAAVNGGEIVIPSANGEDLWTNATVSLADIFPDLDLSPEDE